MSNRARIKEAVNRLVEYCGIEDQAIAESHVNISELHAADKSHSRLGDHHLELKGRDEAALAPKGKKTEKTSPYTDPHSTPPVPGRKETCLCGKLPQPVFHEYLDSTKR